MTELTEEELAKLRQLHTSMQKMQVGFIRMVEAMTEVTNATADLVAAYADKQS